MQRGFYVSALKYMKLRPLVFRRIIVWHCLLFSAWVRWDCFVGKQNNIIGSESLLPKATHCFKILCITFITLWTGDVCQATMCCLLFPYMWRDMLVLPVNLMLHVCYPVLLLTHFFISFVFLCQIENLWLCLMCQVCGVLLLGVGNCYFVF